MVGLLHYSSSLLLRIHRWAPGFPSQNLQGRAEQRPKYLTIRDLGVGTTLSELSYPTYSKHPRWPNYPHCHNYSKYRKSLSGQCAPSIPRTQEYCNNYFNSLNFPKCANYLFGPSYLCYPSYLTTQNNPFIYLSQLS